MKNKEYKYYIDGDDDIWKVDTENRDCRIWFSEHKHWATYTAPGERVFALHDLELITDKEAFIRLV